MKRTSRGVVIDFAELSDAGRDPTKQINEDTSAYLETPHGHLLVVCDGMGGHLGGDVASQTATETILRHVSSIPPGGLGPGQLLQDAVRSAARAVFEVDSDCPPGARPGATCVAILAHELGAEVAHVGDSRLYRLRGEEIEQVTRDHSVVQEMVDAGLLQPEEALDHPEANQITRALGTNPEVEVELREVALDLVAGDVLLLASDGLTDLVPPADLSTLVRSHLGSGPAVACQMLVDTANQRGGHDNITVQIAAILEAPAGAAHPGIRTARGTLVVPTEVEDAPDTVAYEPGDGPDFKPATTVDQAPSTQRNPLAVVPGGGVPVVGPAPTQPAGPPLSPWRSPKLRRLVGAFAAAGIALIVVVWAIRSFDHGVDPGDDGVPPPPALEPPQPVATATSTEPIPLPPSAIPPPDASTAPSSSAAPSAALPPPSPSSSP